MSRIVDMVKGTDVKFTHYKDNHLWYVTECGFAFPVPISDIGTEASFLAEDKASLFIRYITPQLKLTEKE